MGNDYKTFTVRFKRKSGVETEYKKRAEAILSDKGYLYPYLTIQAYLDKRGDSKDILSCGVIKTKDLYNYIFANIADIQKRKCQEGNEFLYVPFSVFANNRKIEFIQFGTSFNNEKAA